MKITTLPSPHKPCCHHTCYRGTSQHAAGELYTLTAQQSFPSLFWSLRLLPFAFGPAPTIIGLPPVHDMQVHHLAHTIISQIPLDLFYKGLRVRQTPAERFGEHDRCELKVMGWRSAHVSVQPFYRSVCLRLPCPAKRRASYVRLAFSVEGLWTTCHSGSGKYSLSRFADQRIAGKRRVWVLAG